MTRSAKRIPAILVLCACLFMLLPFQARAAASGKMVYNDPTVTEGNDVTVNYTVSADVPIGAFQAGIEYNVDPTDTAKLVYKSGSDSAGSAIKESGGVITIAYFSNGVSGPTSISGSLVFQASGTGTVEVETISIKVVNLNEEEITLTNTGTSTVKITAAPTASSEARLSSLSVGSGTLSPAFSSDVYEYSTTVSNDVTRLVVSATAKDSGASVSVSGRDLSVGNNTVTVKVTAADGSVKTYTIHATRQEAETSEEPEEDEEPEEEPEEKILEEETEESEEFAAVISTTVDGRMLLVSRSLDEVELPDDFESTEYYFRGAEVEAAVSEIRPLVLLWLTDEDGENGAFYVYDEEQDDLYPMVELDYGENRYIVLRLYDPSVIPDGFTETVALIDDAEVMAWYADLDGEDTPFLLLWAMNDAGEVGLYRYDTEEGTVQRYVRETLTEQPEEPEELPETDAEEDERLAELTAQNAQLQEELDQANESQNRSKMTSRILIIVACAELLVFALILIFTSSRERSGGDSGPDDDGFGDNEFEEYDPYDSYNAKGQSGASSSRTAGRGKRIKSD